MEIKAGFRSDLKRMRELVLEGASEFELWSEIPSTMIRYHQAVGRFRNIHQQHVRLADLAPYVPLPGWQSELVEELKGPVHSRNIMWYTCPAGNAGKSFLANHYEPARSFVVSGGKHDDIIFAFSQKTDVQNVFFDYGRSQEVTFPYQLLEKFKDGRMTVAKYQSADFMFKVPHVIIFANFPPDLTKLSLDRWVLRNTTPFIVTNPFGTAPA